MKGSTLGFAFLTLLIFLLCALSLFMGSIFLYIEKLSTLSFSTYIAILVFLLVFNIWLVKGFAKQNKWAFVAGGLEALLLTLASLIEFTLSVSKGAIVTPWFALVGVGLLVALYHDYSQQK